MLKRAIVMSVLTFSISTAYATGGTSVVDNNSGIQGVGLATSGSQAIGNSSSNIGVSNAAGGSATQSQTTSSGVANSGNSSAGVAGSGNSEAKASSGGNELSTTSKGNVTDIKGGDTKVERSAPGVFIGTAIQPIGTCRLSIAGGGSSTSGSFAGGIPIGNDMTCLVDARDKLMQRLPEVFTELDRTLNACMIEGMSEFKACKEAKRRQEELNSN